MPVFLFIHSFFLILACGLTFYWVNNPQLSFYSLQLIALFIILFFILGAARKKLAKNNPVLDFINSLILTSIVLLLVLSTGGLGSPLFFLVYFLLFGVSWSLGPVRGGILGAALLVFFLFSNPINFENSAILASLALITPLSIYFGQQYLKIMRQKGQIKILEKKYKTDEQNLQSQESNVLLWLTLNFIPSLYKIIDQLSLSLSSPGVPENSKNAVQAASKTAKELLQSGEYLKEKVDLQTDE